MISDALALLATTLSFFTTIPQLRKSFRFGTRHDLPVLALTGSLLVTGSWLIWSMRSGEPGAVAASASGVLAHALLLWRAKGSRQLVWCAVPMSAFSSFAPLAAVEAVTSALALAALYPHLRSAWHSPRAVSPSRWVLQAGEEFLWLLWAISIAAPLVAAPNAIYVPVSLLIAWRALRGPTTFHRPTTQQVRGGQHSDRDAASKHSGAEINVPASTVVPPRIFA